jgi:hypothetical protein
MNLLDEASIDFFRIGFPDLYAVLGCRMSSAALL